MMSTVSLLSLRTSSSLTTTPTCTTAIKTYKTNARGTGSYNQLILIILITKIARIKKRVYL